MRTTKAPLLIGTVVVLGFATVVAWAIRRPRASHSGGQYAPTAPVSEEARAQPIDAARNPQDVLMRMVNSYLAYERTAVELKLRSGALKITDADNWSSRLATSPLAIFGVEKLESKERAVLMAPTGAVAQQTLMELHWRIECVGVLAWSLDLLPDVPPPAERFDYAAIDKIIPHSREAAEAHSALSFRPIDEMMKMRARLRSERVAAFQARQGHESDEAISLRNSRALERYRAIQWLLTPGEPSLEATSTTPM